MQLELTSPYGGDPTILQNQSYMTKSDETNEIIQKIKFFGEEYHDVKIILDNYLQIHEQNNIESMRFLCESFNDWSLTVTGSSNTRCTQLLIKFIMDLINQRSIKSKKAKQLCFVFIRSLRGNRFQHH